MVSSESKSPLDAIQVQCRIFQITVAFIAVIISIISVAFGRRYNGGSANGYLMMAGIMCWFDTAALGAIGLVAFYKPETLAWYMVLLFDVLAVLASIVAPVCISRNNWDWWRANGLLRFITYLAWLNLIPLALSMMRTGHIWWRGQRGNRIRAWWKEQQSQSRQRQLDRRRGLSRRNSDVWTPEEIRKLEKRVEQLETEARARPFTPSETVARWTTYSGEGTLPDYESQADTMPI